MMSPEPRPAGAVIVRLLFLASFLAAIVSACEAPGSEGAFPRESAETRADRSGSPSDGPFLLVLGIAQDAGYPQAGTSDPAWDDIRLRRSAVSLAVVDPRSGSRWMLEATPDFREQLHRLDVVAPPEAGKPLLDGIFLTHTISNCWYHLLGL